MWEQSKYFDDFENAANYVNGRFDPKAAQGAEGEPAEEAGGTGEGAPRGAHDAAAAPAAVRAQGLRPAVGGKGRC
jgi:hypothetical protein